MTSRVSKSKSAVRAAREAVQAAQREVLERTARNAEDLAVFFSSQERLAGVDEWVRDRVEVVHAQAEVKRATHRRVAGSALAALRDRGETVRDIAALAGVGEKMVRELLRGVEDGADPSSGAAGDAVAPRPKDVVGSVDGPRGGLGGLEGAPDGAWPGGPGAPGR